MSLLNLWSLFKSTLFCHLSLMDKIIVLAPPTKRKHPAPPPVLQQTSPAHFPRNERLAYYSHKAKGRHLYAIICSKQAQQTSGSYTTLEQSERNFRKKPKLESQYFHTSSSSPMQPCSKKAQHTAQKTSVSYYFRTKPKKKLDSFILVLLLYY